MECINLKTRFGDVYRVEYEASYQADRGENARTEDPWLMVIPCQHGHFGVWGGDLLVASTDNRGRVAKRLVELPFTEVAQDGSDGVNVLFDAEDFVQVANLMKPRKRRRLSPEHRQKLVEAGKANRFQVKSHGLQNAPGERRRAQDGPQVSKHQDDAASRI